MADEQQPQKKLKPSNENETSPEENKESDEHHLFSSESEETDEYAEDELEYENGYRGPPKTLRHRWQFGVERHLLGMSKDDIVAHLRVAVLSGHPLRYFREWNPAKPYSEEETYAEKTYDGPDLPPRSGGKLS